MRARLALIPPLLLAAPVGAEVPLPTFPLCGQGGECPSDFSPSGAWALGSGFPPETDVSAIRADEVALGSGHWADRAWAITTGRIDVVIAVTDSGIHWDQPGLLDKHWLNVGEFPAPDGYPRDAAGSHRDTWDWNGDGVFNMSDWAEDPRLSPTLGENATDHPDSVLDPSDLIAFFSDGVDDDGNGFIDDISGWDFFWNDNNPYDDTRYGHGTGEAKDSAEEGGDGGGIGVCPNCMVLSLRVSDSFVADGNNFGNAVLYAADNGAAVVQDALGTINNPQFVQDAIDYAWDRGVIVIASAADETSYHQNYPAANRHTLVTHAVRYDSEDREDATTYLNFSNCTNYGPRLDVSAPGTGCSSEATGQTSGIAGLVVSAGRDALDAGTLDSPLTPAEVFQIITRTTDDIAVNPDDDQPGRYPSRPGWDRFFGYGRVNAQRAVELVRDGDIPPIADLLDPQWFLLANRLETSSIAVRGTVSADRAAGYTWELQVAGSWDPSDADYTTFASGSGATSFTGELGALDLASLPSDPGQGIERYTTSDTNVTKGDKANVHGVTIRLRVTDSEGRLAESRRIVEVVEDPDLLPGYPRRVGGSIESSPKLVDIDGDGQDDLLFATTDGLVHATSWDLQPLPGWPQAARPLDEHDDDHPSNHLAMPALASGAMAPQPHTIIGSPAVGDLDGDGENEVVVGTLNGDLWVWHVDGTVAAGWPYTLGLAHVLDRTDPENVWDYGFFSSPALGDLDNDGDLEIVIGAMDAHVYAFQHDGGDVTGFPVELRVEFGPPDDLQSRGERIISTPALGDIDGDGLLEIAIGTNQKNADTYGVGYVLSNEGQIQPGWPVQLFGAYTNALPYVGEGIPGSPALCDIDGDGTLEVGMHTIADTGQLLRADGTTFARLASTGSEKGFLSNSSEQAFTYVFIDSGSFGDLSGDGVPDYVIGSGGYQYAAGLLDDGVRYDHDHLLSAWSGVPGEGGVPKLPFLDGFPTVMEDLQFFQNPAIADIDGDGLPEAIEASGGNVVHAFNRDGLEPDGWPKPTGQWMLASNAVGDADGDGFLEVWSATRSGFLYAWKTAAPAHSAARHWTSSRHDPWNTGNCETPLRSYPEPVVAPPPPDGEGCACASDEAAAFWPLMLPVLAVRRSTRRR